MASKSHTDEVFRSKRIPKNPIKFKLQLNEEQKQAKKTILENTITLLGGSAGSGKTLLACNVALDGIFRKQYDKIIITRPTVSKEEIGFLPGDSLIIVDEAQNVTHEQMEMITSRIGLRSKMVVCGDAQQTDLKKKSDSGFKFLYAAARKIKNLEAITLKTNHRNEIVEDLLEYYQEAVDKGISITTSGSYIYKQ